MMFHGRPVLKDFTMEVPSGHTVVILGGSGGGKTTVLRLILGLLRPDSGSIRVDGREIVGLPERNMVAIRAHMAMVFQGSALFDSLTVRENVGYRLYEEQALPDDAIERKIVESLCFVGLEDTLEKMPAELSGGMRKRVAIARALACSPEVILYDEPTAAGSDQHPPDQRVDLPASERGVPHAGGGHARPRHRLSRCGPADHDPPGRKTLRRHLGHAENRGRPAHPDLPPPA